MEATELMGDAVEDPVPSLGGATGWLNSMPLTAAELRGRVVLVDFWTFTCINWIRTLPYVRAWAEKYADDGLVVIGVHTPEFGFEHDVENVRRAAQAMGVEYPIAIDNDYAIWRAFDNHYWPALYFVDPRRSIRAHQFGEGRYEESERILQRLLQEAGADGVSADLAAVDADGVAAAADWGTLRTPETYVGYLRAESFASAGGLIPEQRSVYDLPRRLRLNAWALAGDWTVRGQPAVLNEPGGRVAHRFQARDLNLVMASPARGAPVRFRVSLDGRPPREAHGLDVDEAGDGTLSEGRLYQLIRHPGPVAQRTFEIEFLDPGAEVYVFTFG
jgi:thiol-disulfide isomerase/thioredoxin